MMIRLIFIALILPFSALSFAENRESLWNGTKEVEAVCINSDDNKNTCFIQVGSDRFDVTSAEHANLGKLGLATRDSYSRIISFPTKWLKSADGVFMVEITTQAWLNGQRYSVIEPALVKGGIYHQR